MSTGRVEGKVCLVTGGGYGLGRADTLRLAAEGAKVITTDVNLEGAEETARMAGNTNVEVMQQDVVDEERWSAIIADIVERYGKLNVLVNNAGIVIPGTVESAATEDWRKQQQIMSDGVYFGMKYAIPAMVQNGERCSIINMSSTASLLGYPVVFAYAAAKGAVRAMTKSAAVHCVQSGYKIRVNSLHPSGIDTPMVRNLDTSGEATPPAPPPETNGVGIGEAEDVANAVLFLASDESKFINGIEMPIDNTTVVQT